MKSQAAAVAAIVLIATCPPVNATAYGHAHNQTTVLAGVIRSMGVVQEEPAARPQAAFFLDVPQTDGRVMPVLVVIPAPIACFEGENATVSGLFDLDGIGGPMFIRAQILSCEVG